MVVNQKQMDEINAVQYEIFKAFHSVCVELNLRYYLVHGSLLGALRHQGFSPMDDDIDVAMPRRDYDILLTQGQKLIGEKYFIQSHLSEEDYPLIFAKVRDVSTTFLQPVLSNFKVNQGIYIDVFPIDNYPTKGWIKKYLRLKGLFLSIRTNKRFGSFRKAPSQSFFIKSLASIFYPSWNCARDKYCQLYNEVSETGRVIVRGGKGKEVGILFSLFGEPVPIQFNEISSFAPQKIDEYLHLIYGDYMNYEPMGKDMVSDKEVRISADIVDVKKSYKEYINYSTKA